MVFILKMTRNYTLINQNNTTDNWQRREQATAQKANCIKIREGGREGYEVENIYRPDIEQSETLSQKTNVDLKSRIAEK